MSVGKLVLERCPSPPHHGVHPDSQSTVSASDLEALCNEIKLVTERPFDGAVTPSTPRWGHIAAETFALVRQFLHQVAINKSTVECPLVL